MIAVTIASAMLATAGCSVRIVEVHGDNAPGAQASVSPPGIDTPSVPSSARTAPAPATGDPVRADFTDQVQQSLRCTSEPLEIDRLSVIVELTGACGEVIVTSGGSVVLADSIESLTIDGRSNTVLVNSIDRLSVTGGGNMVLWNDGAPIIDDDGLSNILRRARP